jgi:ankyrin repeat protein
MSSNVLTRQRTKDHFETLFEMLQCVHEKKSLRDTKKTPKDIFDALMLGDYDAIQNQLILNKKLQWTRNHHGRSVLHEAILLGNVNIVILLLDEFDFKIDARTMLGEETPLHLAVAAGHGKIVDELLKRGADPNSRNKQGYTPIFYAQTEDITQLLSSSVL